MPTPTSRLGLDDYDIGDTDWDHSDLVQLVDELIEDRGTFANRPDTGTYDGEKYYATDRQIVYEWDDTAGAWEGVMGVGTSDNPLPGTAYRESVHTESLNNTRLPAPGDVQAAIDDLAANFPKGTVWLRAGSTYDPSQWNVKGGVTLKGNGAAIVPTTDTDVIHVEPDGRVEDVYIDVSAVTYTSTVFTIDAAQYGNYDNQADQRTKITGEVEGTIGEGTCIYVHQNGGASNQFVSSVTVDVDSDGIGTYLDLHSEGSGWLNSNRFPGRSRLHQTGIHLRGSGNIKYNKLETALQPDQGGNSADGIVFDAGIENIFFERIADAASYTSSSVTFNAGVGEDNLIFQVGGGLDNTIVDNKGDKSNAVVGTDFFGGRGYSTDFSTKYGKFSSVGDRATAVGSNADALGERSTTLGEGTTANEFGGVVLGNNGTVASGADRSFLISPASGRTVSTRQTGILPTFNVVMGARAGHVPDSELDNQEMVVEGDEANNQMKTRYKDSSGSVWEPTVSFDQTRGSSTQSGDGATTTFTIAHGLSSTPTFVDVTPATAAANGDRHVTADATNITIEYASAPASGTDNLKWWYAAEI